MYGSRQVEGGYANAGNAAHAKGNYGEVPDFIDDEFYDEKSTESDSHLNRGNEPDFDRQYYTGVAIGRRRSADSSGRRSSIMGNDDGDIHGGEDRVGYDVRASGQLRRRHSMNATTYSDHDEESSHLCHERAIQAYDHAEDDANGEVGRSARYNFDDSNTEVSFSAQRRRVQYLSLRLQDRLNLSSPEDILSRLQDLGGYGRYRVRGEREISVFDVTFARGGYGRYRVRGEQEISGFYEGLPWENSGEYEQSEEDDTSNFENTLPRQRGRHGYGSAGGRPLFNLEDQVPARRGVGGYGR